MSAHDNHSKEEIHSKVLRAGRRTYFFDVRATKADDYYLTITESKKHTNENGTAFYKKHKIYLYNEDFERFCDLLNEVTDYIIDEKGEEVISETHQPDFHAEEGNNHQEDKKPEPMAIETGNSFTDVNFEDI